MRHTFAPVLAAALVFSTISHSFANENVEVIGENTHPQAVGDGRLQNARSLAKRGAGQYFVGLGLQYGLIVPLSLVQTSPENSTAMSMLTIGLSLASSGLQISGGIRAGVGASLAYDYGKIQNTVSSKNKNWGFYKGAWGLKAVNAGLAVASFFIAYDWASSLTEDDLENSGTLTPPSSLMTITLISLGVSIVSDALFITSVVNALGYTKAAQYKQSGSKINFSITPVCSAKGHIGARLVGDF
jgi:hypothetical protein